VAELIASVPAEPSAREALTQGLVRENPVFVQVLGMCPTLAVSNSAVNALAMGLATAGVLIASAAVISSLRRFVPNQVRIATFVVIIASFVTAVDYLIQAIDLELHAALGAFVPLIVVNCLILGRMEAFASRHSVHLAVLDALGMGAGFTGALLCLGAVRELLGAGALFSVPVMPAAFQPWTIMLLPGGGFFVLAAWLIGFGRLRARRAHARVRAELGR